MSTDDGQRIPAKRTTIDLTLDTPDIQRHAIFFFFCIHFDKLFTTCLQATLEEGCENNLRPTTADVFRPWKIDQTLPLLNMLEIVGNGCGLLHPVRYNSAKSSLSIPLL